jgi:hypothetical protein
MATEGASFTDHLGIIEYKNQPYFFYHNGALAGGSGYTRSFAVESFNYNSDGTIPPLLRMLYAGPKQIDTLNPYVRVEAETMAWPQGIETEVISGGLAVSFINNNDYIKVKSVGFGNGASSFTALVASGSSGGKIELRLDSNSGTLVGTCTVSGT